MCERTLTSRLVALKTAIEKINNGKSDATNVKWGRKCYFLFYPSSQPKIANMLAICRHQR